MPHSCVDNVRSRLIVWDISKFVRGSRRIAEYRDCLAFRLWEAAKRLHSRLKVGIVNDEYVGFSRCGAGHIKELNVVVCCPHDRRVVGGRERDCVGGCAELPGYAASCRFGWDILRKLKSCHLPVAKRIERDGVVVLALYQLDISEQVACTHKYSRIFVVWLARSLLDAPGLQ